MSDSATITSARLVTILIVIFGAIGGAYVYVWNANASTHEEHVADKEQYRLEQAVLQVAFAKALGEAVDKAIKANQRELDKHVENEREVIRDLKRQIAKKRNR